MVCPIPPPPLPPAPCLTHVPLSPLHPAALTSPVEYFKEGQGSLMQCVITPAAPYMPWTNEQIAAETDRQVGMETDLMGL